MKHAKQFAVAMVMGGFALAVHANTSSEKECVITAEMSSVLPKKLARERKVISLNCLTYKQTTSYTCGPSVAMMIMHYYGKLNKCDMTKETEMRIANEMGTTINGTSSSQLATWLEKHGFSVREGTYATSEIIIEHLKKGIPIIVGMDRHWVLATGYGRASADKSNEDEIYFADSCHGEIKKLDSFINTMTLAPRNARQECELQRSYYIVATPGSD